MAFEDDTHIGYSIEKLVCQFDIQTIVETGTDKGHTAVALAKMVPVVCTIEKHRGYFCEAQKFFNDLGHKNINAEHGSSQFVLGQILSDEKTQRPVLFYLDAHDRTDWPLLDELDVIAKHKEDNSVIVIHDIHNPYRGFGFDAHRCPRAQKQCRLDWHYIRDSVVGIYGENFTHYYNDKAIGRRRGVIYILPGKHGDIDNLVRAK